MSMDPFQSTWITTEEERSPYVELKANKDYWDEGRGPKLNRVIFRDDLRPKQALHLCTSTEGEVDIVTGVAPEEAPTVLQSTYAKLVAVNGKRILAGSFNRYKKDVNFNNRNLRLSFNLAVDREALIKEGFNGYAQPVPALTPPWAFDFPKGLSPRTFDPERARYLLKKSGWPKERALKLSGEKEFEKALKVLGDQFQKALNLKVEVEVISPPQQAAWKKMVAEKKLVPSFDIALFSAVAFFYEGTPAFFHREYFGNNGAFRTGPVIPEFQQLFKRMAAETDREKLLELSKKIDEYVYEEALGLFLCSPQELYAVNRHVNFIPYRTTFELAETSVSESHWSLREKNVPRFNRS